MIQPALRVGIIGHRPDRLAAADLGTLAHVMRDLLQTIREEVAGFDAVPLTLVAVSSLAEGSDRIFAVEAIGLGYELCCPFPFAQPEYEHDFAPGRALEAGSLETFRSILAKAQQETSLVRIEMKGSRRDESTAYGNCSRLVLDQSDVLIVVWDGQRLGRPGGTEAPFEEARQPGKAVVLIDAQAPHGSRLIEPASGDESLATVVRKLLIRKVEQ